MLSPTSPARRSGSWTRDDTLNTATEVFEYAAKLSSAIPVAGEILGPVCECTVSLLNSYKENRDNRKAAEELAAAILGIVKGVQRTITKHQQRTPSRSRLGPVQHSTATGRGPAQDPPRQSAVEVVLPYLRHKSIKESLADGRTKANEAMARAQLELSVLKRHTMQSQKSKSASIAAVHNADIEPGMPRGEPHGGAMQGPITFLKLGVDGETPEFREQRLASLQQEARYAEQEANNVDTADRLMRILELQSKLVEDGGETGILAPVKVDEERHLNLTWSWTEKAATSHQQLSLAVLFIDFLRFRKELGPANSLNQKFKLTERAIHLLEATIRADQAFSSISHPAFVMAKDMNAWLLDKSGELKEAIIVGKQAIEAQEYVLKTQTVSADPVRIALGGAIIANQINRLETERSAESLQSARDLGNRSIDLQEQRWSMQFDDASRDAPSQSPGHPG